METTNFNAALEYFRNEGYRPKGDEARQTIEFCKNGGRLCLQFDENDPDFYRLKLPNFWLTSDQDDWRDAKRAALYVNQSVKCVYVHVGEKFYPDAQASIKAELFCENFDSFVKVWERAANSIRVARNEFVKRVREIQEDD